MHNWLRGLLTLTLSGTAAISVEAGELWPWRWHGWMQRPHWSAPMDMSGPVPFDAWSPGPMMPDAMMMPGTMEWESQYLSEDGCCGNPVTEPQPGPVGSPAESPTPLPDDGFRPATPMKPITPEVTSPTPLPTPTPIPMPTEEPPMRPRATLVPMPDPSTAPVIRTPPRRAPLPSNPTDIEVTPEISIPMPSEPGESDPNLDHVPPGQPTPARSESEKIEIPKDEIPFPRDASRRNSTTFLRRPVPGAARAWISRPDSVVR